MASSNNSNGKTEGGRKGSKGAEGAAPPSQPPTPDVSMKEFLEFFHTTYQLNQSPEGASESLGRKLGEIDWGSLVQSPLVKKVEDGEENTGPGPEQGLARRKLHQVLQEGLLDSVLPYMVPKHVPGTKRTSSSVPDGGKSRPQSTQNATIPPPPQIPAERSRSRKNTTHAQDKHSRSSSKPDVEVEIHVCDELKGLKKTFRCPQRLLVAEMGYFAEVTAGQRLEDMDISVHCDVANFDWLMQWVRREQTNKDAWPQLDCSNVVAVLTSAAFLQMEQLLESCLHFCYSRANEVLAGPANLACLNDSVLSRLASMFSNAEVEQLRDRKDRLQGRLYCKLISALAEPEPENQRGHFASLARMFCCSACGSLVPSRSLAAQIPCNSASTKLGRLGDVRHVHTRSSSWNISEHVAELRGEVRSWRRVYWRLWGEAHWLICITCQTPFPLSQTAWCRVHPEHAQFLGPPPQRACGRHPCCGQRALRFSPLPARTGCQYENHVPELSTEKERAVWAIFQEHRSLVVTQPPKLVFPDKLMRRVASQEGAAPESEEQLFPTVKLDPVPPAPGLLPSNVWEPNAVRRERQAEGQCERPQPAACTPQPLDSSECSSSSSETDDGEEDSASCQQPVRVTARPRTGNNAYSSSGVARSGVGRHWDPALTTRCNQDDQREYEERAMRRLTSCLTRRTSGASMMAHPRHHHHHHHHAPGPPPGGVFVQLEREWRDAHLRSDRVVSHPVKHKMRSGRHH